MHTLLFEIGTEEIPSVYLPRTVKHMETAAKKRLEEAVLPHGNVAVTATPRRLVLTVRDVPDTQEKRTKKVSGPPKKAAVDKEGNPTKAGLGFAKKLGLEFNQLETESTPKGDYLFALVSEGGGETAEVLKEVLPAIVHDLAFPKTMRWGDGDLRFARPIRSLTALLGDRVIDFSLDGIASGNRSRGHRFLSHGEVTVPSAEGYEAALEKAHVFANTDTRKKMIDAQFDKIDQTVEGRVVRDAELIEAVTYLTEKPVAVVGSFDKNHLDLPRELLVTVMKHHQRYFSVESKDGDALINRFVAFSNIDCKDMDVVRRGYERVLTARLSDARFFFDEDRKKPLASFAEKLSGIVYIKGLGTIADKVARVVSIAGKIAAVVCPDKKDAVAQAARLCKADLTTNMVFEFPELQGIMGREYAKAERIDAEVANAIDEHYLPRFSGDDLPSSDVARCVALAEKIDTLVGCHSLELTPATGSADPFALRRNALGVIRILLESCEGLSITNQLIRFAVDSIYEGSTEKRNVQKDHCETNTWHFIKERIKVDFRDRGFAPDVVDAVLGATSLHITEPVFLPDLLKKCEALAEMKKQPYAEDLAVAFKRAANITKDHRSTDVDESLLAEDAERALHNALRNVEATVAPLKESKDFAGILREVATIKKEVDDFFDGVMVMAEDEKTRNNRLGLLKRVTGLFADIVDFSRLVF